MSATTNTKYDEAEGSFEGRIRMYITRTYSVEIDIHSEDCVDCDEKIETFRCNLAPIFTFIKQKLKDVDWEHISRTRNKKWGYKRLEPDELFDMLSNDRI